ncbi:MAG: SAM-dependent methyltransferase [Actinomycetota bacterium]|nr:SAM-dependent methyltransferase [Actinomycetota bacterium]
MSRALDSWWHDLGSPDPFVVVAGAGTGTLAASVLAARPQCLTTLRYVLVERSAALRRRQAERLALEPAAQVLGPRGSSGQGPGPAAGDPDDDARPLPGQGPLATSLATLPAGPFTGVVLANELLDNLPFRLLECGPGAGWSEVRVGEDLAEVLVPAPSDGRDAAHALAPDAAAGARIPLQDEARRWLGSALRCLSSGRVVVLDYADVTSSMARRPWTEWVRTYRGHARGGHPLAELGEQDVTCEVAVDQLARVRNPVQDRSQAAFLRAFGVDRLAEEARQAWHERAAVGDLEALKARSRVGEAAALTDDAGLGRFRVLEWEVAG